MIIIGVDNTSPILPLRFEIEPVTIPYTNNTDRELLILSTTMSQATEICTWSLYYKDFSDDDSMDKVHDYLTMEFGNVVIDLVYLKPKETIEKNTAEEIIMETLKQIFEEINPENLDYGEEGDGDSYTH